MAVHANAKNGNTTTSPSWALSECGRGKLLLEYATKCVFVCVWECKEFTGVYVCVCSLVECVHRISVELKVCHELFAVNCKI